MVLKQKHGGEARCQLPGGLIELLMEMIKLREPWTIFSLWFSVYDFIYEHHLDALLQQNAR